MSSMIVAPASPTAASPKHAAAAATAPKYPERRYLVAGLLLLVAAWAIDIFVMPGLLKAIRPTAPTFTPPDGISAFALFFLAATIVERVIEPFSSGLVRATPQESAGKEAAGATGPGAVLGKAKADALTARSTLVAGLMSGNSTDVSGDAASAAAEQATADQAVVNATFVVWAVATIIAVPLVTYFALSLPAALGVAQTNPNVDQLVTALVVGAGTKPLHDFLSNVEKGSQAKETNDQAT